MAAGKDRPAQDPLSGGYRQAALAAAAQNRLLPGEDPDTTYLDDAANWIAVYGELLSFKTELLRVAKTQMKTMTKTANDEIRDTDRVVLEAERRRFVRRLKFWQKRHRELAES